TGLFETGSSYDEGLLVSLECARALRPEMASSYSLVELRVEDMDALDETISELRGDLKGAEAFPGIAAKRFASLFSLDITEDLRVLTLVIFFLALIAVYHSMHMVVRESEWELRILRSLGATRLGLVNIIILDSILFCLLGGIIGVILGAVVSNSASIALTVVYRTKYIPPAFSLSSTLNYIFYSVIVGLVGGAIPAYRGSRI
ncbi:MAG: ABC transporter permease, partial [Candidatus Bathyarchaeia archaeon]